MLDYVKVNIRLLKQTGYGIFFLLFWLAIGFGVYRLYPRPAPSCFDGLKNGAETGLDCGGGCLPCELKSARLRTGEVLVFKAGPTASVLAVQAANPIKDYGARFDYQLDVFGSFGVKAESENGSALILPGGEEAFVFPPIALAADQITRASFKILSLRWLGPESLPQAKIDIASGVLSPEASPPYLETTLTNSLAAAVPPFYLSALVFDASGRLVAASEKEIIGLAAGATDRSVLFFPPGSLSSIKNWQTKIYWRPAQ